MSTSGNVENKQLICEICDFQTFLTYSEFNFHHLSNHIRQPKIIVVKLNERLAKRLLNGHTYRLKTGVARRANQSQAVVSPLRIVLSTHRGQQVCSVLKTEPSKTSTNSEELSSLGENPKGEVEGNNLLKRFGASITFGPKVKPEPSGDKNNGKTKENDDKTKLLERLSGIGGISISSKSKTNPGSNTNENNSESASVTSKSIDISQFKSLKKEENSDKKVDNISLLKKLSNIGGISIGTKQKSESKPASSEEEEEEEESEDSEEGDINQDSNESVSKISVGGISITKKIKPDENNSESDAKSLLLKLNSLGVLNNSKKTKEENQDTNKTKTDVLKSLGNSISVEQKPKIVLKSKEELPKQEAKESIKEGNKEEEEVEEKEEKIESGRDILERLSENLAESQLSKLESVPVKETVPEPTQVNQTDVNMEAAQMSLPLSPTPSEQLHPDFIAPPSECNSPCVDDTNYHIQQQQQQNDEQQQQNISVDEQQQQVLSADCSMLITTPAGGDEYQLAEGHDGYIQQTFVHEQASVESTGEEMYTTIDPNDPNQQVQQGYWTDSGAVVQQEQQSPQHTGDVVSGQGETVSQALRESLLQNFLNDAQQVQVQGQIGGADGSEFMSLDRLANSGMEQQSQQQYEQTVGDPNSAPMQQLTQQVQRIPQSQITVVPSHQLMAQPQPPPMHPAPTIAGQHHSPQPSSYDPMSQMQQQMPPLYQGYNMYNQTSYTVHQNQMTAPQPRFQSPQPPRPQSIQQRPQMQNRQFAAMMRGAGAGGPRARQSTPAMKRPIQRMPTPQMLNESSPQKQRRLDQFSGVRPQQQKQPQLPPGISITPPKKQTETNKVANVLASRGITVTSTTNRQSGVTSQNTMRSPQRLNSSGGSQHRTSGGFVVPGPRRSGGAIVNHNVERPERCTTVDLTLDDDPPPVRNRIILGKFPCNQCTKIFTSAAMLENHKATHRAAGTLAFKCDRCSAQYPNAQSLKSHKISYHKVAVDTRPPPDLCLPIVDLSQSNVKDQLSRLGIHHYVPLSQLRSNTNGIYGIPIASVDSTKDKVVSNLHTFGANNYFMLGKIRSFQK